MPKFAANLSMLYTEVPFLDRFDLARHDEFNAVEFLFPYGFPRETLVERLKANGLKQILFNAPPGGTDAASIDVAWARGDRGTTALPGRESEFREGFKLALEYAAHLDCPRLHAMAGIIPPQLQRSEALSTYIDNLSWAAEQAAKLGMKVMIEPINQRDMPGYFLNRQDHAHEIVDAVGAANLQVQMDLYHCQIVEGDVAMKLRQYLPTGRVGHLQIAGVPERQEPDVGELNYKYLFSVIDQSQYSGWVGCEYRPKLGGEKNGTSAGLSWRKA